ncbi:hypothetical protein CALVIDRAFT_507114 [Calocera viscosa TUFC12733]|uniref:Endonuclease/exonuclease/phosphatase domain-containing protein n=1 Tax=Calocera viscosa (strain TUFC12733) TaxID=1330018 RepID=A0A167G7L5_CALVF|nr:hypothetical protein CALVIDRAFT_507114 [Calocera viscosa TUFC12733]
MEPVTLHPIVYNRTAHAWENFVATDNTNAPGGNLLLFSWNINGLWSGTKKRLGPCLDLLEKNLKKLAKETKETTPKAIICIQEFHGPLFESLLGRPWIQNNWFVIAPVDIKTQPYDVITLVSTNLGPSAAFLLPFKHTAMGRRVIFVDLPFQIGGSHGTVLVRIGNTHLESLDTAKTRKLQLEDITSQLSADEVHCGIIGGDLNANAPSDEHLPEECGLTDVWSLGVEDGDAMTWGWTQKRWPHGRFDKFLLNRPDRMPPVKAKLIKAVKLPWSQDWITDHHCLVTILDCSLSVQ